MPLPLPDGVLVGGSGANPPDGPDDCSVLTDPPLDGVLGVTPVLPTVGGVGLDLLPLPLPLPLPDGVRDGGSGANPPPWDDPSVFGVTPLNEPPTLGA